MSEISLMALKAFKGIIMVSWNLKSNLEREKIFLYINMKNIINL